MTAQQAISTFLNDGDCLALGGFSTNRRAYGLVREIIKQKKKNLYVEGGPSGCDIDMLIGAGCVKAMIISYIANSGYSMVGRRFRDAIENNKILFDDYSLDVQTIAYHAAALGLNYVPVKNMLGSDLAKHWGISEEERKKHPKLPPKKFILQDNPFKKDDPLFLIPTPQIDVACIHVQKASPDGTVRIEGPWFQDMDIAIAAKRTIISCEELLSNEEIRRNPELNTVTGLCIDAVVHMPMGAHPSQCFGYYDYDSKVMWEYEDLSKTKEAFDEFLDRTIYSLDTHNDYLNSFPTTQFLNLAIDKEFGYKVGIKRNRKDALGL